MFKFFVYRVHDSLGTKLTIIGDYLESECKSRRWTLSDLAVKSRLADTTIWRLRAGLVELKPQFWLRIYYNANIKVPLRLLDPKTRETVREALRHDPRPEHRPLPPCGAEVDWPPGTICSMYRGGAAFEGSGCYHVRCPYKSHAIRPKGSP